MDNLICEDQITNMKYGDILDASMILSVWVANQSYSSRVHGTYRDSIWSNADTKIYAVRYMDVDDG